MIRLKFSCQSCGKAYSIKAESRQALSGQSFKCPACGAAMPFAHILSRAQANSQAAMHTHIAGAPIAPDANMKTRVASGNANQAGATMIVENTGCRIFLAPGRHTLGRDSADSTAIVRVAPDIYMSRNHALLQISKDSGKIVCYIQPLKSANSVIVNSIRLAEGLQYNLRPGDKVLLGTTTFHLEF